MVTAPARPAMRVRLRSLRVKGRQLDDVIRVAEFRSALRHFLSVSERVASRHGLTPQRYLLLLLIKGAPDRRQRTTVTELTDSMQLAQHTVTELVNRAVKVGLVRREASLDDRRVTYVSLTAEGDRRLSASFRDLEVERRALAAAIARIDRKKSQSRSS